ncbi:MAG: hypothetical protein AB1656_01655 [Candidatus Omnitrophota bacterium]
MWRWRLFFSLIFVVLIAISIFSLSGDSTAFAQPAAQAKPAEWWDGRWTYRLPVMIQTGGYERIDKPVEIELDFIVLFNSVFAIGEAVDPHSIRVIEVERSGKILREVDSQFDPAPGFDPLRNAVGSLIWMLDEVPSGGARFFYVYFDSALKGAKPKAEVKSRVTLSSPDGDSWKFSAPPYGFYTFQKSGGAFRIFAHKDVQDNAEGDWVRSDLSHFQGIPNLHSPDFSTIFHQTYDGLKSSDGGWNVKSEMISEGPLKMTIRSRHVIAKGTSQGEWEIVYEIFPSTIRCTVTKGNENGFAFIQEAAPGGNKLGPEDFARLANEDQPRRLGQGNFNEDLSPEWAYQGEDGVKEKLYFIHAQDDKVKDAVLEFPQYHFWVVGWGRGGAPNAVSPGMKDYPAAFYFGFREAQDHAEMVRFIESLRQPLPIITLPVEKNP